MPKFDSIVRGQRQIFLKTKKEVSEMDEGTKKEISFISGEYDYNLTAFANLHPGGISILKVKHIAQFALFILMTVYITEIQQIKRDTCI